MTIVVMMQVGIVLDRGLTRDANQCETDSKTEKHNVEH